MTIRTTALAAVLALASALPAAAQELKFANFTAPGHTVTRSVIETLNTVASEASGGSVTVRGYHGGELGAGPVEQYVRAVQGGADITWGLPGYTSSQFGKTMMVEAPFAVPEGKSGADAIWDAYEAHLAGEFPATVPVAIWTSEPNVMIMRDKVVRTPADLEGLKIRVAGAVAGQVAEALGATPVQMPINQVYNALQTGLIDGVFTGSSTLGDFKLDEVAAAYTFGAPLGRLSFFAVMNEGVFNGLPDATQASILENARRISNEAEAAWNETAETGVAIARELPENTFVDLTEDEAAAFADLIRPVTEAYVGSVGGADAFAAMQQ